MEAMFRRLAAQSRAAVERVHGDSVTIYPVTRAGGPNGPRSISAETGYATVACFYENTLAENDALAQPRTGHGMLNHAAPAVFASIALVEGRAMESGFYMLRDGDGAVFEIGAGKPDGLGGIYAMLNRAKALPEMTA